MLLLKHRSDLKQKEIAEKLNRSLQVISAIKKKLQFGETIDNSRAGSCGRKEYITTSKLDRKIKVMAINNRRAFCIKLFMELKKQGMVLNQKAINNRLFEQELKAYTGPRKKPRVRVTQKDKGFKISLGYGASKLGIRRLGKGKLSFGDNNIL